MSKKILLIDDEKDFCFFTKNNLEATGQYVVTTCSDSSKAVDLIKGLQPDLILLDVLMPEIDGPGVAASLKEDEKTKNIPIVFLTAVITEKEARQSQNLIAGWPFIAKPVQIKELVEVINRHIRK
ncbi:MAG: response regulator [Candidatus Omnitrophota bacterium]